jgi:hypothetical protein
MTASAIASNTRRHEIRKSMYRDTIGTALYRGKGSSKLQFTFFHLGLA